MNQSRQNGSVWGLTSPPPPETSQLDTEITTDVLIIGGGFSGLSSALHLHGSGLDVVLIEANSIGWGASGRNGGHVLPLIRKDPAAIIEQLGVEQGERLIHMIAKSANDVFSLIKRFNIECNAEQGGWINAVHSAQQMSITESRYADWLQYNAKMTLLDGKAVADFTGTESYVGGLLVQAGGHINPLAYARGLAKTVIDQGVKIYTGTPAVTMQEVNGRWHVVTPTGKITAKKVILATAAYSDNLWPQLRKSFLPFYLYNIATRPLDADTQKMILPGRQPVTDTRGDARVFHYDSVGRLITGGTFVVPMNWNVKMEEKARNVLSATFPQLGSYQFESDYIWRGKLAMTTDTLPHIHKLAPNVYTWVGCNARGIALSTSMGAVLADAVKEVDEKDWALQPTQLKSIPMHTLSRLMTSIALLYYRFRDNSK